MSRQPGLLTSEEFAALHVEGARLELIRGELCVMPPAFADHGETVGALHAILGAYVRTYNTRQDVQRGNRLPRRAQS
jgi:Uma2 family endonuclease